MAFRSARPTIAILTLVFSGACTRANPIFADDASGSDGSSGDGSTTDAMSGSASASTASTASSTVTEPTTSSSEEAGTGDPDEYCGDAIKQPGEECDAGEDKMGDETACLEGCILNVCGDGHRGPNQACDDGNDIDDDECSNDCIQRTCLNKVLDEGEICDPTAPMAAVVCTPACLENECGDGYALGREECDDNNDANDDDCVVGCLDWRCGDQFVNLGSEDCDDANTDSTDSCVDCQEASCGDGFLNAGVEQCDPNLDGSYSCEAGGLFGDAGGCSQDSCELDLSDCNHCGDMEVNLDEGEQCDFGPNGGVMDCTEAGWVGGAAAILICNDQCQASPDVGCCLPVAAPCSQDGPDFCCGAATCNKNGFCGNG